MYKTVKVPLSRIVRKDTRACIGIINDIVQKCHKIAVHAHLLIKLYMLHCYDEPDDMGFPVVTEELVRWCLNIFKGNRGLKRHLDGSSATNRKYQHLFNFYITEYLHLMSDEVFNYHYLAQILNYMSTSIVTDYENNIKAHYVDHVERYVNVCYEKKQQLQAISDGEHTPEEKRRRKYELVSRLRLVKHDILSTHTNFTSPAEYHQFIREARLFARPNKANYEKNSLRYDAQAHPQDYMKGMIWLMRKVEEKGEKLLNVFPLRTSIVPCHIRIDTMTVLNLLLPKAIKSNFSRISNNHREIWSLIFKTNRRCFRQAKKYEFHHQIETDGVSCSIILKKCDEHGSMNRGSGRRRVNDDDNHEKYITDLLPAEAEMARRTRIIGIDPGMNNIMTAVDGTGKGAHSLLYSQRCRNKECNITTNKKRLNKFKESAEPIENQTIIQLETELSLFSKKTLNYQRFKDYIIAKIRLNNILGEFYERYDHRKLKLSAYVSTKRHEQLLIQRFEKKFGAPSEVTVAYGDWEQKKHMKYKPPTKGVGMRKLLRKYGYKVYLVDEFRTSYMCSSCSHVEGKCKPLQIIVDKSPVSVHGVLICQRCNTRWSRDINGAINIYKIATTALLIEPSRPAYLARQNNINPTTG